MTRVVLDWIRDGAVVSATGLVVLAAVLVLVGVADGQPVEVSRWPGVLLALSPLIVAPALALRARLAVEAGEPMVLALSGRSPTWMVVALALGSGLVLTLLGGARELVGPVGAGPRAGLVDGEAWFVESDGAVVRFGEGAGWSGPSGLLVGQPPGPAPADLPELPLVGPTSSVRALSGSAVAPEVGAWRVGAWGAPALTLLLGVWAAGRVVRRRPRPVMVALLGAGGAWAAWMALLVLAARGAQSPGWALLVLLGVALAAARNAMWTELTSPR